MAANKGAVVRLCRIGVVSLLVWMCAGVCGCSLFTAPRRDYTTNDRLLTSLADASGYRVADEEFELVEIDLRDDVITYQYRGVEYAGDQAWVIRFSEKSTEQNPAALSDIDSLTSVLREGRRRFEIVSEGTVTRGAGDVVSFVAYRFDSTVQSNSGVPFEGRGVVAVLSQSVGDLRLIYQIKLDNYGDRTDLAIGDLDAFLQPLGLARISHKIPTAAP